MINRTRQTSFSGEPSASVRGQQRHASRWVAANQSGKTLIELIIVMSSFSVMLLLGLTTIHMLIRSQAAGGVSLARGLTVSHLARDFRQDVHSATTVELAGPQTCTLKLPGGTTVAYQVGMTGITRTEEVVNSKTRRELYRLPEGEVVFEVSDSPNLVTFIHRRQTNTLERNAKPESRETRLEATLSRDLRFAESKTE